MVERDDERERRPVRVHRDRVGAARGARLVFDDAHVRALSRAVGAPEELRECGEDRALDVALDPRACARDVLELPVARRCALIVAEERPAARRVRVCLGQVHQRATVGSGQQRALVDDAEDARRGPRHRRAVTDVGHLASPSEAWL
eukprot:692062-Prymnesium_polylepis.1